MNPLTDDCPVWAESGAETEVEAAIPIEIAAVSLRQTKVRSMKLRESPAPSDALVTWACRFAEGVRLPADRPWFLAPPPSLDVKHWEYRCRCRRAPVRVGRYLCDQGRDYLYLGQCPHCETIIWSYRHCHEIVKVAA